MILLTHLIIKFYIYGIDLDDFVVTFNNKFNIYIGASYFCRNTCDITFSI